MSRRSSSPRRRRRGGFDSYAVTASIVFLSAACGSGGASHAEDPAPPSSGGSGGSGAGATLASGGTSAASSSAGTNAGQGGASGHASGAASAGTTAHGGTGGGSAGSNLANVGQAGLAEPPQPMANGFSAYERECHGDTSMCVDVNALRCLGIRDDTTVYGYSCSNPCTTDTDCSDAPSSAEARAACVDFATQKHCLLVCQNGTSLKSCPSGMSCYVYPGAAIGYCLWP